MKSLILSLSLFLVFLTASVLAQNTPLLDIHIIAHTHDDVGWLKTVDQYYIGSNNSIQDARVQYIIDTVVQELVNDPTKKFIYVEIAYFWRWWNEQDVETQQIVQGLVASGQLEFINAGWCMSDESAPHHDQFIDNMWIGHQWVLDTFGVAPKIAWHIDPFGHAASSANMFSAMGLYGMFFARIDWQDYDWRVSQRTLEFVWRGSESLGSASDIFTHVLWDTTYCYPPGFAFEWNDPPIQNDPNIFGYNMVQRANLFAAEMRQRAEVYVSNQIFVTFGCDFGFSDAWINYKNMDKLIAYINENNATYGLNMFYSTPSIYVAAVNEQKPDLTLKTDDFFPYSDNADSYWTGYMTSRPSLKGYFRESSSLLHSTERLFTLANQQAKVNYVTTLANITLMQMNLGIAMHHDAIAGTQKQPVANDHVERVFMGQQASYAVLNELLGGLVGKSSGPEFSFCPYLNVSICWSLVDPLTDKQDVPVVFHNNLAQGRNETVRLISPTREVGVVDYDGNTIPSQVWPNPEYSGLYSLAFNIYVPPLGLSTYFVTTSSQRLNMTTVVYASKIENSTQVLEGELYEAHVVDGYLAYLYNKQVGSGLEIHQNFLYYSAWPFVPLVNPSSSQNSGAYIFRPNISEAYPIPGAAASPDISFYAGPILTEIRQVWNDWVNQTVRLYNAANFLELDAVIGPIDISDGQGKEIITRFNTTLSTNGTWYTDAAGLDMQERVLNSRFSWPFQVTQPVAGNYVPINNAAFMNESSLQFTFVTDRSRGCASLADGEFETMYHRRLLYDDGRGVGEPLNETEAIRTVNWIFLEEPENSAAVQRPLGLRMNNPLTIAFAAGTTIKQYMTSFETIWSPITDSLPENVHVLSLLSLEDGTVILRLQHIFAAGEDAVLSQPATVDVAALFSQYTLSNIQETSMTANQPISDVKPYTWNIIDDEGEVKVNTEDGKSVHVAPKQKVNASGVVTAYEVTLEAMQIRTFTMNMEPANL